MHMAASAIRACLEATGAALGDIELLCTGTSGGDATLPGFTYMLQGKLAAPPMITSGHNGVCFARVVTLQHARDGARKQARTACAGRHQRSAFAPMQAFAFRQP